MRAQAEEATRGKARKDLFRDGRQGPNVQATLSDDFRAGHFPQPHTTGFDCRRRFMGSQTERPRDASPPCGAALLRGMPPGACGALRAESLTLKPTNQKI